MKPNLPAGLDFGLAHAFTMEIPLVAPSWKLRVGGSNDYNSPPGAGIERLDTNYFTRLVLNWR